jgi:RNA polymerase sigma factor (sigma-70 family)
LDDSTIVGKCQGGQAEFYGQLVDKYSGRIINLGYAMMGNRHDAEDVAQEAFVRAYKGLGKFQKKAKFSSWLYQIALNLCKDHLKAKSRHARPTDEEQLRNMDGNPKEQAPAGDHPGRALGKMREAINKLPCSTARRSCCVTCRGWNTRTWRRSRRCRRIRSGEGLPGARDAAREPGAERGHVLAREGGEGKGQRAEGRRPMKLDAVV